MLYDNAHGEEAFRRRNQNLVVSELLERRLTFWWGRHQPCRKIGMFERGTSSWNHPKYGFQSSRDFSLSWSRYPEDEWMYSQAPVRPAGRAARMSERTPIIDGSGEGRKTADGRSPLAGNPWRRRMTETGQDRKILQRAMSAGGS